MIIDYNLKKRKFIDSNCADIICKFSIVQLFTVVLYEKEIINFYIFVFLFVWEQMVYFYLIFKETRYIRNYNRLVKSASMVSGKVMPWTEVIRRFDNSYSQVYEIRIICKYKNLYCKGKTRIEVKNENINNFLELLNESEMPILFADPKKYYVLLEEFAERHGYEYKDLSFLFGIGIFLRVLLVISYCLIFFVGR